MKLAEAALLGVVLCQRGAAPPLVDRLGLRVEQRDRSMNGKDFSGVGLVIFLSSKTASGAMAGYAARLAHADESINENGDPDEKRDKTQTENDDDATPGAVVGSRHHRDGSAATSAWRDGGLGRGVEILDDLRRRGRDRYFRQRDFRGQWRRGATRRTFGRDRQIVFTAIMAKPTAGLGRGGAGRGRHVSGTG
jgi:hypothetical protein